jgi:hypothetical protein
MTWCLLKWVILSFPHLLLLAEKFVKSHFTAGDGEELFVEHINPADYDNSD